MSFDTAAVAVLLDRVAQTGLPVAQRGKALEDLAVVLFDSVPGVSTFATNSLDVFKSQEIDVVLANDKLESGFLSLGRELLVECKNWAAPVGALEIAWFYTKLRTRGLQNGLLLAANGITGSGHSRTSANAVLAHALSEQIRIIVLTLDDIRSMCNAQDLVTLCRQRELELLSTRGLPSKTAVRPL